MISLFDDKLEKIDKKIASIEPFEGPDLFYDIPLDIFGYLLLDAPLKFPNMRAFFPSMVSNDVQDRWTGCHGISLLNQSLTFIKTLVSGYETITIKKLKDAIVLDFVCGWGRLIRLLYKY